VDVLKAETNLLVSTAGQSDGDGSKQSVEDFEAHVVLNKVELVGIQNGN
jgi:hypothetical protein